MSIDKIIEKMASLRKEMAELHNALRNEGAVWVDVYPGEDEDEAVLKQVGAVCMEHMVAYSSWDGYGSRWVCTQEQYNQYKALMGLDKEEEED